MYGADDGLIVNAAQKRHEPLQKHAHHQAEQPLPSLQPRLCVPLHTISSCRLLLAASAFPAAHPLFLDPP
jgi:hypothetical protein